DPIFPRRSCFRKRWVFHAISMHPKVSRLGVTHVPPDCCRRHELRQAPRSVVTRRNCPTCTTRQAGTHTNVPLHTSSDSQLPAECEVGGLGRSRDLSSRLNPLSSD